VVKLADLSPSKVIPAAVMARGFEPHSYHVFRRPFAAHNSYGSTPHKSKVVFKGPNGSKNIYISFVIYLYENRSVLVEPEEPCILKCIG
jgi:hypothetical protein